MDEWKYEIFLRHDSKTSQETFLVEVRKEGMIGYFFENEFVNKKYLHLESTGKHRDKVEECLSICRDELIDRGLING